MNRAASPIRRVSTVALLLAFCLAGSPAEAEELPETDGAFYAISVRSIDEAISWYTQHLGFKLGSRGGNDMRKGALLIRPETLLELAEFSGAVARGSDLGSHEVYGIFKIGFTTANLDETYEFLEQAGVEVFFPIVTASDGNRTFGIKDMDGNIIQFFGK